jgi:hypothetical protein
MVKSPGNNESLPGADALRYVPQASYAALGAAGLLAAAVAMATTSWLIMRTAVFGRWLAWLGAAALDARHGSASCGPAGPKLDKLGPLVDPSIAHPAWRT